MNGDQMPVQNAAIVPPIDRAHRSGWRRPVIGGALVLVATVVSYDGRIDGNPLLYHEGERLAHLDALWSGALPYRDVYVTHGFGENIVKPLVACRLYGRSLEALRRLGQNSRVYRGYLPALGVGAFVLAALAISRDLRITALAAALACMTFVEITDRHLLGWLALACAAGNAHSDRRAWLAGAGALAALAGLYSLDMGLYAIAAIGSWLVIDALWRAPQPTVGPNRLRRSTLAFAAGILAGAAPFLAWCAYQGILGDFGYNTMIQLAYRRDLWSLPWPRPTWTTGEDIAANLASASRTTLLFYVMPGAYLASAWMLIRLHRAPLTPTASRMLLVLIFAICHWMSVFGRSDEWHVAYAAGPFLLFGAMLFWTRGQLGGPAASGRIALVAAILVVAQLGWLGEGGAAARRITGRECSLVPDVLGIAGKTLVPCDVPRMGRVRVEPDWAAFLADTVAFIQSRSAPDETMVDLSYSGMLHFLAQRRSPSRFYTQAYVRESLLRDQMATEILAADRLPRLFIVHAREGLPPGPLGDIVRNWYQPAGRIAHLEFWRCADTAAPRTFNQ